MQVVKIRERRKGEVGEDRKAKGRGGRGEEEKKRQKEKAINSFLNFSQG